MRPHLFAPDAEVVQFLGGTQALFGGCPARLLEFLGGHCRTDAFGNDSHFFPNLR